MKKVLITNNAQIYLSTAGGYSKQIYYLFNIFKQLGYEIHYLMYAFNIDNNESHTKQYTYYDFQELYRISSEYNDIQLIDDDLLKEVIYYSVQEKQNQERLVDAKIVNDIVEKYNIDLFLCLGDAFVFRENKENAYNVPSYYWYPCHYYPFCNYDCLGINSFSNILSLSPSLKIALEQQFPNKNVYYLPHVVEKPEIKLNKDEIRKKWNIPTEKHVVLLVCGLFHEQQDTYIVNRKSIDTQLIAFKKFNEKYTNTLLFLHSVKDKYTKIYPLEDLIEKLVLNNKNFIWNKKLLDEIELHELYEMADTFLNCTKGEGFGVPILEAQSHNINIVTNNFCSMREHNFQDNIAEISSVSIHYGLSGNWAMPSSENIFNILEELYLNGSEKNKIKQNRAKWIVNELTSYNNIKNKLEKIIQNTR
jgi:hypothetical protein